MAIINEQSSIAKLLSICMPSRFNVEFHGDGSGIVVSISFDTYISSLVSLQVTIIKLQKLCYLRIQEKF